MAYTQKYGRGNRLKTGGDLPAEFLWNNEPPTNPANAVITPKIKEKPKSKSTVSSKPDPNQHADMSSYGIRVNESTDEASPIPYEKTAIRPTKNNQTAYILNGKGETIKMATGKKAAAQLIASHVSDSIATTQSRIQTAAAFNGQRLRRLAGN